mgnify:FL=1
MSAYPLRFVVLFVHQKNLSVASQLSRVILSIGNRQSAEKKYENEWLHLSQDTIIKKKTTTTMFKIGNSLQL